MVASCVSDDDTAATLGGDAEAGTLPSVTEPDATLDSDDATSSESDESADGDESSTTTEASTTTTMPADPLQGLGVELVAEGFAQPVHVTAAPGTDNLYVVEREGVIRVVADQGVTDEPFLDLTDRLLSNSIEQGLLGLTFHPGFAENGRLYAYWTDPEGDSRLAEFTVPDPTDPLVADPDSERLILAVDQPAERHNAGMIQFGPDGFLYLALGDGGSGGSTAQDTSNLLGSIVRLDVDGADGSGDGRAYGIPAGNPFGSEIWVYGLRNPWRFFIDAETELMYIGDVGQDRFEEINVVGLDGAGTNFGWIEMEGDRCFRSGCDLNAYTLPVLQYGRDDGCSVTGGVVYRGAAIPEFDGHYFFGDWCKGWVRSMRFDQAADAVDDQFDWTEELAEIGQVTSFGLDADGELLTVNWDGQLHRVVAVR
jgi:glucose/arabinose dehydrogenase